MKADGEMDTGETKLSFASLELAKSNGVDFTPSSLQAPSLAVEIAFIADNIAEAFSTAVSAGAIPIAPPKQKPWGQTVA